MVILSTVLLVTAFVLFILAGLGIETRYSLIGWGLACLVAIKLFESGSNLLL